MTNFNKLTPMQTEAIAILAEECGEVIQECGKILRHGLNDYSPHDPGNVPNIVNLQKELGDVLYATRLAMDTCNNGSMVLVYDRAALKPAKTAPYLHHQKES